MRSVAVVTPSQPLEKLACDVIRKLSNFSDHTHVETSVKQMNYILTRFSSLAAPEVVKLTTSVAASDENFVKMTFGLGDVTMFTKWISLHSQGTSPDRISLVVVTDFYPGPVKAFAYCRCLRLCVCVSVCVRVYVNPEFVCAITLDPFKLESPNLDQMWKASWLRSLLFWRFIDLEFQCLIHLKIKIHPIWVLSEIFP